MDPTEMQQLVRRYWDGVWRDRNLELLDELLTDPYVRHSADGTRTVRRHEVKRDVSQSWDLLHGAETTIDDQVIAGDKVWTRSTMSGVNLQTGERSLLTWLVIHRVENGRFAEVWSLTASDVDWR